MEVAGNPTINQGYESQYVSCSEAVSCLRGEGERRKRRKRRGGRGGRGGKKRKGGEGGLWIGKLLNNVLILPKWNRASV